MLKEIGIFHTPKNWEELQTWLTRLNGPEAVLATTAAMMAWNLAAKTVDEKSEAPGVEKLLALSTAHMPKTSPNFGGLQVMPFDSGYVVWVAETGHGVPNWIWPVMEHALDAECTLILFERDCPKLSELKTWDW